MGDRELVMLGTSSQVPTRERNHVGAALRWGDEVLLFDPGEGTQRQLASTSVSAYRITRVCLTHFHGDHCLGLPGVVQQRALAGAPGPLVLHYPPEGEAYVDALLGCSSVDFDLHVERRPVAADEAVEIGGGLRLSARALDHRVPTVGWRLDEAPRRHVLPDRLAALGIEGADIGRLVDAGRLEVGGRTVTVDQVSEERPNPSFAWVLDTRPCEGATALAAGVTMLVSEATYLDAEAELAREHRHTTARQAAELAAASGVHQLVITHYSQRYADVAAFEAEARAVFPDAVAARDLDTISVAPAV